jgi:sulfur relay (sulfurtransferase) DsrF/TusC family protein
MLSVQRVANELNISTDELIQQSVNLFVQQQLIKVEAELFRFLKKYGIKNVFEMDEKLKNGSLRENDVIDDFFAIDHLENERERLLNLLKDDVI